LRRRWHVVPLSLASWRCMWEWRQYLNISNFSSVWYGIIIFNTHRIGTWTRSQHIFRCVDAVSLFIISAITKAEIIVFEIYHSRFLIFWRNQCLLYYLPLLHNLITVCKIQCL
jgi:hypothetical protein